METYHDLNLSASSPPCYYADGFVTRRLRMQTAAFAIRRLRHFKGIGQPFAVKYGETIQTIFAHAWESDKNETMNLSDS